ncbi:MAG: phosphate acyltransferase PlsX [Alphaproteobacteria bacterium]|nr:phosphate acyltransferase PlsX [Alphaproteobacteria bacterium]
MQHTIAIDAMGGDHAPQVVIAGADMARARHADLHFLLFGDEAAIAPLIKARAGLERQAEIVHTPDRVEPDAKPSQVLRHGRKSSMGLAIEAVKEGRAAAVVSAGNTGALMALSKFVLKTLPGIERPAIGSLMPTRRREIVFLDLGANAECDAENLVQFAVMGEVFAREVLGIDKPTVGLLNIGTEDLKGNDTIRQAAAALRESSLPIEFRGFVEGTDLTNGTTDVVVTDGFTGNVALKVAEGTAGLYTHFLRQAFKSSFLSRIGYLLSRGALNTLRQRLDPRRYNGAMFLGLNGVVIKSHGGTDALGFANAINVAVDLVQQGTNQRITAELGKLEDEVIRGLKARAS